MTRPRKALISLQDTPYYHITSRCVRRAFLCGVDHYSGQCYEHRRQWVVDRIRLLASLFAIDICAYAVMSNHYHLVLKLSPEQLEVLSDDEIVERWCALFKGPLLIQQHREGKFLSAPELATVADIVSIWRTKLASISWFMRCLNQPIARQANLEDGCTGKFWESRFTSQALKTDEALLSCMAYVDLNPVRAKLADTPEKSDHTSIQERLAPQFNLKAAIQNQCDNGDLLDYRTRLKPLLQFEENALNRQQNGLLFQWKDYLELVDSTGRLIHTHKRGTIMPRLTPILERLKISADQWMINSTQFESIHAKRFNRAEPSFNTG